MKYYHHTSTGLGKNSAMNLNCLLLPTTFLKGWMVVKMWTLLFWIFLKRLMLCHINTCCANYDYMVSRGVHSNGFLAFYRVAPKLICSSWWSYRGGWRLWCAPRHGDGTLIVFAVYKWLTICLEPHHVLSFLCRRLINLSYYKFYFQIMWCCRMTSRLCTTGV